VKNKPRNVFIFNTPGYTHHPTTGGKIMAKEISRPPKERINITYQTETGGAIEQKELPLKLLMIGDYTLKEDLTPVEDRKPINVDKDNFDKVLQEQNLTLTFNVPDRLSEDNQDGQSELSLNLKFDSLKDFQPEQVARQVPDLEKVLKLREALVALKGPLGNIRKFRETVQDNLKEDRTRGKLEGLLEGDSELKELWDKLFPKKPQ
jgi:type VI secretion system protein ImpB